MKKKEIITICSIEVILVLVFVFILNILFNYYLMSYEFSIQVLPEEEIPLFQMLTMIYRIYLYIVSPFLSFLVYRIISKKIIKSSKKPLSLFYSYQYLMGIAISTTYVFFALDIRYNHNLLSSIDFYIPVVGYLLYKFFKQTLELKKE